MTGQRARFLPSGPLLPVVGGAALVAFSGLAVNPLPASASTTFVVNRIGDAPDLNLTNAKCDTSTASGNQCTLRAAIQEANDTPGADTINFNITSASKVITPGTQLPAITGAVTINGYTQAGTSANTQATGNNAVLRIVLDGVNAGAAARGLRVQSSVVTIRGLVIQRWRGAGIALGGSDNVITGNFIGTTAGGGAARANGIGIEGSGAGHRIGGSAAAARNLISGNLSDGILLTDTNHVLIAGNYIGTNAAGTADLGNGHAGISLDGGTDNVIGRNALGAPNLVSGNDRAGIDLVDTTNSTILGNLIGTDATGMNALGNSDDGVEVFGGQGNRIGGTTADARNTISDNKAGIDLLLSDENTVQGNRVGTRSDGTGNLGNRFGGILISGHDNQIGGPGAAGNIVANTQNDPGLIISGDDSINNVIQGNAVVGNANTGILVFRGQNQLLGNSIISNAGPGVRLNASTPAAISVRISGNVMIGNAGLGIDLPGFGDNSFGVTPNDACDGDTGAPNLFQNFPVLTSAVRQSNGLTIVSGSLNSTASTQFRIELFFAAADPSGADPSGHGEAQAFLTSQDITTNATCTRSFSFALTGVAPGIQLTATAINLATDDTSEFSLNRTVTQAP
jgi:CSLREA domain-containing protein